MMVSIWISCLKGLTILNVDFDDKTSEFLSHFPHFRVLEVKPVKGDRKLISFSFNEHLTNYDYIIIDGTTIKWEGFEIAVRRMLYTNIQADCLLPISKEELEVLINYNFIEPYSIPAYKVMGVYFESYSFTNILES